MFFCPTSLISNTPLFFSLRATLFKTLRFWRSLVLSLLCHRYFARALITPTHIRCACCVLGSMIMDSFVLLSDTAHGNTHTLVLIDTPPPCFPDSCVRFHFAKMNSSLLINAFPLIPPSPLRVGPHAERKRPHIVCASPHGRACRVEKPHIVLDVGDVSIAPDEDNLREASSVVRMGRVRVGNLCFKRRNKDCIFQLRAFSRRRDRRVCTIMRNWRIQKKSRDA